MVFSVDTPLAPLTMLLLPPSLFYYISLSKEKEIVIGEGEGVFATITETDGVQGDVRQIWRAALWHDAAADIAKGCDFAFYNCFIIQGVT
jgi:hypothetical protein